MAYTFGGATTDDITTTYLTMGGNSAANLWGCWIYPTTLTAGRFFLSGGDVVGLAVDTTTSEIRFYIDRVTTDTEWVTSGAGIVTNTWQFVCFCWVTLNGNNPAVRCWVGTEKAPPAEISGSAAVAGSGNYSATGTSIYVGNRGTGSVAFQGDVAEAFFFAGSTATGLIANALWLGTSATAIDQGQADFIKRVIVDPTWRMGLPVAFLYQAGRTFNVNHSWARITLRNAVVADFFPGASAQAGWKTLTINGATYTANHPGRSWTSPPMNLPPMPPG